VRTGQKDLKHGPATRCLHYPLLVGLGIVAALATIGQAERHGFLGSVIGTNLDPSQALATETQTTMRRQISKSNFGDSFKGPKLSLDTKPLPRAS
jgi:hypothetical protein